MAKSNLSKNKTLTVTTSVSDILGGPKPVPIQLEKAICVNCNKVIPDERLKALKMLGTPKTQWTHTNCSTTSKIKGIYMGEVGTSQLQLCDKVYNDTVRSVFRKSVSADDDEDEDESDEKDDR